MPSRYVGSARIAAGSYAGSYGVYVPHASKQLHQSTVAERETHDQVWRAQAACTHIDQAKDEGGESESTETEWCRVGEFAVLDTLVETWLELTTEGGQTLTITGSVLVGERTIAESCGGLGGLVLFVGHLAVDTGAIGFFVVDGWRVASVLGIGLGGHGGLREVK